MNETILVIEDNEQNSYLMRYLLEQHGLVVVAARDGREGIARACDVRPAVILLDIQRPVMDGYAVAAELRRQPQLVDTPIIAVTSYAMVGDRERALAAGVTDYVEKPLDPVTFFDRIRPYLADRSAPRGGRPLSE